MNPASPSDSSPMELMNKGVCVTKYVERFGGFGKARETGFVMWQVAMIMDYLQSENWMAARDGAALLCVCLEQTAMDSSMDVGLLMALVEDPPSGLFSNRSLAPLSRGRSSAALANQQWIATALSLISSRRGGQTCQHRRHGARRMASLHQRQSQSPNQRGLGRRSRSRLQMGRRHERRPLSFCGAFW